MKLDITEELIKKLMNEINTLADSSMYSKSHEIAKEKLVECWLWMKEAHKSSF